MTYWRKPLDLGEVRVPHARIRVLWERCKGCGWCVEYCPRDCLVISEEINAKGYHPPEVINENECTGCGLCEMICPEFAIFREEEELVEVVEL